MELDKEKLVVLRKERGWSQSRLATISGLSERTIQRIEKEEVVLWSLLWRWHQCSN
ncbi:helix-turn-helix transcriptional regulator [Alteromonas sp. KUL49]|uniref:helix-turn-helix transcriptional regulator n=1 Tax=Alteromonas sp. KUL49 TaxID=2480798 RepID=UPI001F5ECAB9|nr:helix-turn-helix transcriptional regulator [Alteromonas sp. KUL49]